MDSIASLLTKAGFRVTGQADNETRFRQLVSKHKPDIIMLDWEISETRVGAISGLTDEVPNAIVVIITRPQPYETFVAAMREGVTGFLSVNLPPEDIVQSLRMLIKGDLVVSRDLVLDVQKGLAGAEPLNPSKILSEREQEVLELVSEGATNNEIAQQLIVSDHTVKTHLRNILNKLNLRNRQQAAAYAVREGLAKDIKLKNNSQPPL